MGQYGTIETGNSHKAAGKTQTTVNECERLLSRDEQDNAKDRDEGATRHLLAFYTSHGLFMWSNRCFEFAALLFTASAFPHTLVQASIRALCAHLASVIFSPSIGRWLSRYATALWPVQGCIVVQRVAVAMACLGWISLMARREAEDGGDEHAQGASNHGTAAIFVLLIVLGILERLSAVANVVIVERVWLPLLSTNRKISNDAAESRPDDGEDAPVETSSNLHLLNATTKRIDLVTKLVAPLAVSQLIIGIGSLQTTAVILALLQPVSGVAEMYCTVVVWRRCISPRALDECRVGCDTSSPEPCPPVEDADSTSSTWRTCLGSLRAWYASMVAYFCSSVFLPSLAYVLEPLSVLTLAGSMTAYLLAANFSLNEITIARSASTAIEIASTILTPVLISYISNRRHGKAVDQFPALVRVGIIGLSWQVLCLLPVTAIFLVFPSLDGSSSGSGYGPVVAMLFVGLALSRLGPFAYSLVEQQIIQVKVTPADRVTFSSVETALFDVAELARWGMLLIFSTTQTFRWVVFVSYATVVGSWLVVVRWARRTSGASRGRNVGEATT